MKRNFLLITGLAVLLAGVGPATAQTTVTVTSADGSTVSTADITNLTVYTNGQDRRTRRNATNQMDLTRTYTRRGGYTQGAGGYTGLGAGGYAGGAGGEFYIIASNNIFDASRYYRAPRGITGPPPPIHYYFTLLGTGKYANEASAFFSDTGIERNNRAFAQAETINGFKIAEITNDAVKLVSPSNEVFNLKIGMQMTHTNNGPWQLVVMPERATTSSLGSDSSDTSPDSGPSAPEGDIARRLRLRREAEMGGGPAAGAPPPPPGDAPPPPPPPPGDPSSN